MESFFSRYKNALVLIALLLAQTIALATQLSRPADPLHPDGAKVRLLRLWTLATVTPIERLAAGTGHGVRNAWADYVYLRSVRRQNALLQDEIARLRLDRAAMAEDAQEGKRLRRLLNFRQGYLSKTVVAQVIGTSGSDASRLLTLDKGARDGLRPDMAVITPDGIVGKLRDVFPATSQLLLISDPTSGAGVVLASSRIHAIVRGSVLGRVQILNLTPDSRIKAGETVMTSGGDRVFPRGLQVGTIETIALDPEHQPYTAITLRPAVNLAQLEEVLIVTDISAGSGAGEGEMTADASMHAADVSADRLPSLHAEKAADGVDESKPPPDNSTSLVPKPKAAMHPDKFSPGAVGPAAELVPGAAKSDARKEVPKS